jgi:hypothetical protein
MRLITIWTGANEIMDLVIRREFYKEFLAEKPHGRDVEADAEGRSYRRRRFLMWMGKQFEEIFRIHNVKLFHFIHLHS